MKKFLLFILKILILTIVITVVLDFLYTGIYLQSNNRDKITHVYNSKNKNYDVIILGSSRGENHFVSRMFEEKGLKTFNYGMCGGNLFEADLLLKLMIERNYKIKNVILETDLNLAFEHQAEGVSAKFLPYLHLSETIKIHFQQEQDFTELYYIPFYRYIKFENRIGFRETFLNLFHKKSSSFDSNGYHALIDETGNMKMDILNLTPLEHNKYYVEMRKICKENKINLIAVMTPMCENTKGINYFEKVQKFYPEIHNYENAVVEDKYFSSCGHMNDIGARLFTARIIKDFFNK